MEHRSLADLEPHLEHLEASPKEVGTVALLACRPARHTRRILDEAVLGTTAGLVGDSWSLRDDESARPDLQVSLMNARMAALLSGDPARQALAGDQLYVDLDLSRENLPTGSRLAVGTAVLEVSATPHLACGIFIHHFGPEAARFVNGRDGRRLRLRGVKARVVTGGTVHPGDKVTVHREPTLW